MKALNIRTTLIAGAIAALALGFVSPATASASRPQPSHDVVCVVGGETAVTWRHSKVTGLQIVWNDPGTSLAAAQRTVSSRAPHGQLSLSTPVAASGATTVHIDFYTDSGSSNIDVACT